MDSEKLGNAGKTILGSVMIIIGVLAFVFLTKLAIKSDYLGCILLANILATTFLISKGLGIGFLGDKLEESIVVDGNTTFSTTKTPRYLTRRMIVCFIDTVATFICAIITICSSQTTMNIIGCVLLIVASLIFLLVALASKGDLKKLKQNCK